MTQEFYSLVTNIGVEKQTESIRDGIPFDVAEIAIGDSNGEYYEPDISQTSLRNEVWRGNIEKFEWEGNKFYCITTIPASIGNFTIREAGVFDSNNNLIVITKFPLTIKQAPSTGTIKELTIRIELELSNEELANLIVNPNITLVSKDEFNTKLTKYQKLSEKGKALGYAPLNENTKIPIEFIPQSLTPFSVNSCLLDNNGNPNFLSFQGNIITASAPFTYTTADGNTFEVKNNLTLNTASLQSASYNLFIKENSGIFSLCAYANSIYTQINEPSNPNQNDIWLKTFEPLFSYIRNGNAWNKTNLVPIGSFTLLN